MPVPGCILHCIYRRYIDLQRIGVRTQESRPSRPQGARRSWVATRRRQVRVPQIQSNILRIHNIHGRNQDGPEESPGDLRLELPREYKRRTRLPWLCELLLKVYK
jgi:hypothetical protein